MLGLGLHWPNRAKYKTSDDKREFSLGHAKTLSSEIRTYLFLCSNVNTINRIGASPMCLLPKPLSHFAAWVCAVLIAVLLVTSPPELRADLFEVTQWDMATGVSASFPHGAAVFSQTVMNPFVEVHTAIDGASSASTAYNFSWNATFGDFLLQVSHRAADVDPSILRSVSDGFIYITTNADTLFSIDGNYSYSLPVDPMVTIFNVSVSDAQPPHDSPIGFGNYYGTEDGAPASGSFPIGGQAILPAGHTWLINYLMEVEAFYGYSGQITRGDGYLHFTLQEAVPEPAAFLPLALAALALRRRR